jgi:hypothetical protein
VAIAATHLALEYRMMVGQLKRRTDIQVTLETSVRRFSRIDNGALCAAGLNVQTAGTVARLATHVLGVLAFRLEAGVRSRSKIAYDLLVACCAFF